MNYIVYIFPVYLLYFSLNADSQTVDCLHAAIGSSHPPYLFTSFHLPLLFSYDPLFPNRVNTNVQRSPWQQRGSGR